MTDRAILRIAEETCNVLGDDMPWHMDCRYLVPSYNAALMAARANHEDDMFLGVLASVKISPDEEVNAPQMRILFTQLRIAIESLMEENGARIQEREAEPGFHAPGVR